MLERENSLLAPDSIYSILYPVVLADSQTRLTRDLALDGTSLYIWEFTCLLVRKGKTLRKALRLAADSIAVSSRTVRMSSLPKSRSFASG